jgi:hypothetical protein
MTKRALIDLSPSAQRTLIAGARDSDRVRGLTHAFYKYPARFSPLFAHAAIEAFTRPGDTVLDNHVGGGTTLVEALALGRDAIGVDISTLAEFVSRVKTTILTKTELAVLQEWVDGVGLAIDVHKPTRRFADYEDLGYYKHLDHPSRWRLRKAIDQALHSAINLGTPRLEAFGRCVVLRTGQWALDGRKDVPTVDQFRHALTSNGKEMLAGARELRETIANYSVRPRTYILNRSAAELADDKRLSRLAAPNLVLTSPPYPGVHVLYHRWQVDGGKEAPAPFLIASKLDGAGSSYYTMGDRKYPKLATYFENIRASMSSVASLASRETTIVQMVAFSDPSWQLRRYLAVMEQAGLTEVFLPILEGERDGRLWRDVPSRRWYSDQRGATPGSQEVVLIHRRSDQIAKRLPRQDRSGQDRRLLDRPNSESSAG